MLGDPILSLVFGILRVPAVAFIVGALLYQFKFRAHLVRRGRGRRNNDLLLFRCHPAGISSCSAVANMGAHARHSVALFAAVRRYYFSKHIMQGDYSALRSLADLCTCSIVCFADAITLKMPIASPA